MDFFSTTMKKYSLLVLLLASFTALPGQSEKNYILEVEGDTVSAALNETINYKTKDGKSIAIKIRKKAILDFKKGPVSFSYPSQFSVATKKVDDDVEQILLLSAAGTGVLIQVYHTINPENGMTDMLLAQITEDDKNAGYTETKTNQEKTLVDGKLLKGKKSVLRMDAEEEIFSVFSYGKGKKGISVVEMDMGEEGDEAGILLKTFWSTFRINY